MSLFLAGVALLAAQNRIHCVSDISHEFSFYMDGRFSRQYLETTDVDVRNWGTLHKLDLSKVNLLALSSGDTRVAYAPETVAAVRKYVQQGGGLVLLANGNSVPEGKELPLQKVADPFGLKFGRKPVRLPLATAPGVADAPSSYEFAGGSALEIDTSWRALVVDAAGKATVAVREFGEGRILAATRGMFGSNPDASDPLNQAWIKRQMRWVAGGKRVDESKRLDGQWAEKTRQVGPLTVEFHEGTEKFADAIAKEYTVIRPLLVDITGVEPSPGMITRLLMLPTGGGGFSSGDRIAIGAWWGDYPTNRYPMVELIGHEAGHSWVLPHPEPVWNEPIATYLGILVGRRLGMKEGDDTLRGAIERAKRKDPDLRTVDIGKPDAPNDVVWGKTYFLFEELERLHGPGMIGKYFKAKRRLVPANQKGYSLDDSVAVWSAAAGKDLFAWFRSYGIDVDRSRTKIATR